MFFSVTDVKGKTEHILLSSTLLMPLSGIKACILLYSVYINNIYRLFLYNTKTKCHQGISARLGNTSVIL